MDLPPLPPQPPESEWRFVEALKAPIWEGLEWSPQEAKDGEASLREGVRVLAGFPDPEGLLETAYADLADFFAAGGVPEDGPFVIETTAAETPAAEAYRVEVTDSRCRVLAADTEGIRRGLFHVENLMLASGGPFLPVGVIERKPFIESRISRCFFGPILRPPMNRDELMDDVDYYPDAYLNRLAHEGINGLWLSVRLNELCKTSIVPETGHEEERRLAKLRRTVAKCRRHGIRVFLFGIEPQAWDAEAPVLKRHPELGSFWPDHPDLRLFCPFSEAAQQHLYEMMNNVFSAVPSLGGLINISHGERLTSCLSSVPGPSDAVPACPVCATKAHGEILGATLGPMLRGMRDAAPDTELIAWLYMPYEKEIADWVYDVPRHIPDGVTLQFNFESGVVKEDFGRKITGGDYWLSTPGPSPRFERIARAAQAAGMSVSAKIQTGCSHEVATVPFVPVPGMLYRKFRAMRELGVSHTMLCWYFGNYPGPMNRAAGDLSFEPFPETEEAFLLDLASTDWGDDAPAVAQAWRRFAEGYSHYPLTNVFQYYGPMHDGVVWPLRLKPEDTPLMPTWQIAFHQTLEPHPPSGDRIGEALGESYSLAEALELCRAMSEGWDRGLAELEAVATRPATAERRLDVGVAKALGLQFRSGLNALRFYGLRERLFRDETPARLAMLEEMRRIVKEEIHSGAKLIALCERDSRLGFHSEAEGYKYFPDEIRWRVAQLRELLATDFPAVEAVIREGRPLFPEYTGREPLGPVARSRFLDGVDETLGAFAEGDGGDLEWHAVTGDEPDERETAWSCLHDREALYVLFRCAEAGRPRDGQRLIVKIEPRRLWTCLTVNVDLDAVAPEDERAHVERTPDGWRGWVRVPFADLGREADSDAPLRINVIRDFTPPRPVDAPPEQAWIPRHPWLARLRLGDDNPADLGWLFLA